MTFLENAQKRMKKILLITAALLIAFAFTFMLTENVSAQQLGCCLNTKEGDFCADRVSKDACEDGFFFTGKVCGNINQCQSVTCIPPEGECQANKPLFQCQFERGKFDARPLEEVEACQSGGCNIGNVICEVLQRNVCEQKARESGFPLEDVTFTPGLDEIEIRKQCGAAGRGTCDLGGGSCDYTTSDDCANRGGNFISGLFPSQVTACGVNNAEARRACGTLPGDENKIFWFNDQGSQEALIKDCGYPLSSCQEEVVDGAKTAICKSTACEFELKEKDSDGRQGMQNLLSGTSMCYNFHTDIEGRSTGLQHQILHCANGKIQVEGLGPDRNKRCIDEFAVKKEDKKAGLELGGNARVVDNLWQKCRECGQSDGGILGQLSSAGILGAASSGFVKGGKGVKAGELTTIVAGISFLSGGQNRIGDVFQIIPIAVPPGPWINSQLIGSACGGKKFLKDIGFVDDLADKFGFCKYQQDFLPWGGFGSAIPKVAPGNSKQCFSCGGGGDDLWNICTPNECNALGDCQEDRAFTFDTAFRTFATTALVYSTYKTQECFVREGLLGATLTLPVEFFGNPEKFQSTFGRVVKCWEEFGKRQGEFYDKSIGEVLDRFGSPHKKDALTGEFLEKADKVQGDNKKIGDLQERGVELLKLELSGEELEAAAKEIRGKKNVDDILRVLQKYKVEDGRILDALGGASEFTPPVVTTPAVTTPATPGGLKITISGSGSEEAPLTMAFQSSVEGGASPYTYEWNFGDGSSPSSKKNPGHKYAEGKDYTVTLTVTDKDGNKVIKSKGFTVGVISVRMLTEDIIVEDAGEDGKPITLAAEVRGLPGKKITYLWKITDTEGKPHIKGGGESEIGPDGFVVISGNVRIFTVGDHEAFVSVSDPQDSNRIKIKVIKGREGTEPGPTEAPSKPSGKPEGYGVSCTVDSGIGGTCLPTAECRSKGGNFVSEADHCPGGRDMQCCYDKTKVGEEGDETEYVQTIPGEECLIIGEMIFMDPSYGTNGIEDGNKIRVTEEVEIGTTVQVAFLLAGRCDNLKVEVWQTGVVPYSFGWESFNPFIRNSWSWWWQPTGNALSTNDRVSSGRPSFLRDNLGVYKYTTKSDDEGKYLQFVVEERDEKLGNKVLVVKRVGGKGAWREAGISIIGSAVRTPGTGSAIRDIFSRGVENVGAQAAITTDDPGPGKETPTREVTQKTEKVTRNWYTVSKAIVLGYAVLQGKGPEAGYSCSAETSLIGKGTSLCKTCESEDGFRICTKERCEILGQCKAIAKPEGDGFNCVEAACEEPEGQRQTNVDRIEADFLLAGNVVKHVEGAGSVNAGLLAWNVTEIKLKIFTGVGANCRFSTEPGTAWENAIEFEGAGLFPREQEVILSAGGAERQHAIFVKCQNVCGIENPADNDRFFLKYEKGKLPDFLPPEITHIDPFNVFVPEKPVIVTTQIHLSENGVCFFSRNLTVTEIQEMQSMDCAQNQRCLLSEKNACGICKVDTDLSKGDLLDFSQFEQIPVANAASLVETAREHGIEQTRMSRFVFRCQDLNGNQGEINPYILATVMDYDLTIIDPKEGFSTFEREVPLKVETAHSALCKFSLDSEKSFTDMQDITGEFGLEHETVIANLTVGQHTVFVACEDFALQQKKGSRDFSINLDNQPPTIIRAFRDFTGTGAEVLKIVTDEISSCRYSLTDPGFAFEEGIEMPFDESIEHIAEWGFSVYYIKCRDRFDNEGFQTVKPISG